jgi:outer membrane protein assembly factor BamA
MTFRFKSCIAFILFTLLQVMLFAKGNALDTTVKYSIQRIDVIGNKVTKYHIIERELTFKECDLIDTATLAKELVQSRLNLMNTTLFNFVAIHYVLDREEIFVYVTVTERWYIWPAPIIEIPDRNPNIWLQMRDLSRLNYGAYVMWNNFRGRKETLQFIIRLGYSERYGLAYTIPNLGKHQRSGLGISYGYSRNHEIGYKSEDNVLLFYKDEKKYTRQEQFARLRYTYRKVIFNSHAVELRYNQTKVTDTILQLAPTYTFNDKTNLEYFSLNYFFAADHRDYKPYALKGWIYTLDATQTGLGILKDENFSFFKLESGVRYFNHFKGRWYGAYGLKGKWSSSTTQPYYVQRGLGYSDYIRGYEYYVIDGHNYGLFKTNLKYQLIKPNVIDFNYFKNDKFDKLAYAFYLNAFFDAGYVKDNLYFLENSLNNNWQYSYGLGLDFIGYYDMVFRFEVARNRMNEIGFFFHYFAPI